MIEFRTILSEDVEEYAQAQGITWWLKTKDYFRACVREDEYGFISGLLLCARTLKFPNCGDIPAAGIGRVWTKKEYRGLGHATCMLRSTIDYAERMLHFPVLILHSGRRKLYQHAGFQELKRVRKDQSLWIKPLQKKEWSTHPEEWF